MGLSSSTVRREIVSFEDAKMRLRAAELNVILDGFRRLERETTGSASRFGKNFGIGSVLSSSLVG